MYLLAYKYRVLALKILCEELIQKRVEVGIVEVKVVKAIFFRA